MNKEIRIKVCKLYEHNCHGSLIEFISQLNRLCENVDQEHREKLYIEFDTEFNYGDTEPVIIKVSYTRDKTEKELEKEKDKEDKDMVLEKAKRLEEYKNLKKEFDDE